MTARIPLPDAVLSNAIQNPYTCPSWVLRELLEELAAYRVDEEHVHVAPGGSQRIVHSHPGGTRWHGYFGHPEDRPAPPDQGTHERKHA